MQTTWMWYDDDSNSVNGVMINQKRGILEWFNQPDCACGDSDFEQSIADFLERGAVYFVIPPADIQAHMRQTLLELLPASGS